MHQVKVLMLQLLGFRLALATKSHLLSQKTEVRVVTQQTQHDEIGVETVQTVTTVGVVLRLGFRLTDVLHDLVFAFSGDLMTRQHDFHALPVQVLGDLLVDEVFQLLRELRHELGTRGNAVAVEWGLLGHFDTLLDSLLTSLFSVESSSETASTLLVHLGARGDTIDGHEEELLGLDLAKQMLDVVEDGNEHLVLGHAGSRAVGVIMRAVVNDTVHVKLQSVKVMATRLNGGAYVETVKLGDAVLSNELRDARIPLGHPSEELGNTHDYCCCLVIV